MSPSRLPLRAALFACVAVLGLSLAGCGSSVETTPPGVLPNAFPNHSPDDIRTHIAVPTDSIQRFAATARVQVRSPDENRSFNAQMRQQRADSLFMRFSLFGFEGGRLLMTPDSVFLYDARKNALRVGPLADAQEFLPAPIDGGKIFVNLLGLLAPDPNRDWSVRTDSTYYYLSNPNETEQWKVDPRRWRVVQYKRQSPDGRTLDVRRFSNFRLVEGVSLPHTVTFRRPEENVTATFNYQQIDLNPSGLSYELGIPSKVPREPLRTR